ncbi:hypothetical protein HPB48_006320 [Haemaphysalis longicornis]|uniref:Uncharacterized protein n=1 Tax=Haemaphysalis longicornis TaxID=44386 RepID=A0A9J6G6N0_HAELO|nr:hypothetical protein HPB48_006320 [Haemaphysalis longicornis]
MIMNSEPRSIFVHFSNHCQDLALKEVAKNCYVVDDALNIANDVSNAILESKNRKPVYSSLVLSPGSDSGEQDCSRQSDLFLTASIEVDSKRKITGRLVDNYERVQATLQELAEVKSSLSGTSKTTIK